MSERQGLFAAAARARKSGHCCQTMADELEFRCDVCPDSFVCTDQLVHHSEMTGEYGIIIHDGGTSYRIINFCPWCGANLKAENSYERNGKTD